MHKQRVAQDFSASASVYDSHAFLQQRILRELAGDFYLNGATAPNPTAHAASPCSVGDYILDAGTGTGMLAELWPQAQVIGLDIAEGMCRAARARMPQVLVADMESLPLASASVDGVFSSLALQWLEQPERFYAEAFRVCKPGGWLRVATLAPQTLGELRAAYAQAGLTPPVLDFKAGAHLARQAEAAGWKVMQSQENTIHTQHESVRALLHYVKALGARHKQGRGLKTPADLRMVEKSYARKGEEIESSWQVAMLWARKP